MTYQLLHNYWNIDTSDLFTLNNSSITRGHNLKLFKPLIFHPQELDNHLSIRVINDWNNLPHHVIYAPSLDCSWSTLMHSY